MKALEIEKILQKWSMKYGSLHAVEDDKIIEASDFEHIAKEIEQRQEVVPHNTVVSAIKKWEQDSISVAKKLRNTGHKHSADAWDARAKAYKDVIRLINSH